MLCPTHIHLSNISDTYGGGLTYSHKYKLEQDEVDMGKNLGITEIANLQARSVTPI
jgi:hypothetical protein